MYRRTPLVRRLALWTAFVSLAGIAGASDWGQFRGPNSNGLAVDGLPEGDGQLALDQRWVVDVGSGYSGVVVAGDRVVTLFADGDKDYVGAFSAADGSELWRFELEPTYQGHDGSHDGPIATPMVADGRVFALGARGRLVAVDLATGSLSWSVHLVEDLGGEKPWYGFGSSPLRAGDNVVVGMPSEEGGLVALNRSTGELAWQATDDSIEYQSAALVTLLGQEQIVVGAQRAIWGVEPTGRVLWSYEHGGRGGRGAGSLTVLPVSESRVFIDHDDKQSALLQIASGPEGWTAEKVWEGRALINSYVPPVTTGGSLYGYTTRFLSAVDPETGEELFRSREPGDGFPLAIEDQLVVATKAGGVHIGPASREGWKESGSLDLFEAHSWTPPSYADGSLYLRSFGQLARVDLTRSAAGMGMASAEVPARIEAILAAVDRAAAVEQAWKEAKPPWIDGTTVTFAWRGEAADVGIGGDMIGVRDESPMNHVEGTDLWWYAAELPAAGRVNYAYLVDFEATIDPHNPRTTQSTVFGPDMNLARPEGVEMSWLAMPEWQQPDHYAELPSDHPRGTVVESELSFQPPTPEGAPEAPPAATIGLAVWTPPGYEEGSDKYPVLYVLDGQARELGGWVNTLDRLVGDQVLPVVVAFVDLPRLPGPMAMQAFQETVVSHVETEFRVDGKRDSRALHGAGGSSSRALLLALHNPDFARGLAMQSVHSIDFELNMIRQALAGGDPETVPLDIYLEWGVLDLRADAEGWDMRDSARQVQAALIERGYQPQGGEVVDSTDWAAWRNRTDVVLRTLFPK